MDIDDCELVVPQVLKTAVATQQDPPRVEKAPSKPGRQLFLFRHAKTKTDDPLDGELTSDGEDHVKLVAEVLAATKQYEIDRFICSPAPSCRNTAKIVSKTIGWDGPIEISDNVSRLAKPYDFLQELQKDDEAMSILVVGHDICFYSLTVMLCGAVVDIRRGGCCGMAFDDKIVPSRGEVAMLVNPRHLQRL